MGKLRADWPVLEARSCPSLSDSRLGKRGVEPAVPSLEQSALECTLAECYT